MKIHIINKYKSTPKDINFELPDFSVITGKNGSGKTHLLQALSDEKYSKITNHDLSRIANIKLIKFGELNPSINETCTAHEVNQFFKDPWNQIKQLQNNLNSLPPDHHYRKNQAEYIQQQTRSIPTIKNIISTIIEKESIDFHHITEDHVYRHTSLSATENGQIFTSQLARIFKTYQARYIKNEFQDFLNKKDGGNRKYLPESDFLKIHGPKPWEIINSILLRAGLSHKVIGPDQSDIDSDYTLRLIEDFSGTEISANDLSTGEKVLMSLALAIYNTQDLNGKPDLLILDEPDAPLHPEYSKLLIEVLTDIVVKEAGVKVIITTHSPTTVALCPDNSLYEIDKSTKIPSMISISKGIEILTKGIPHLKVSFEERRQIFVESKYDVQYFERLHNIIKRNNSITYTPIFLEPNSHTSNCTDVITIVENLSKSGSDLARGIIDFDGKNQPSHNNIKILGNGKRYAIENYLLDPLFIGLALVREKKKSFRDFSIDHLHTYIDATKLTEQDAQKICDHIIHLTSIPCADLVSCETHNGWKLNLPTAFTLMRGHDWESLIFERIPEINAIAPKGKGDSGLKLEILTTIEEFPQYLSKDIFETLSSIY